MTTEGPREHDRRAWPALLPIGYALAVTIYGGLRYGYRWGEQDTGLFVKLIRQMLDQGTILPDTGSYQHGYNLSGARHRVLPGDGTGCDAGRNWSSLPFLSLAVALVTFVAFRGLLGDAVVAGIATMLLFMQPEFVFVIGRGNHEKITYILILSLVFLLTASLTRERTVRVQVACTSAFYLIAWGLITTNFFWASSFLASLLLALGGGALALALAKGLRGERATLRRLAYTTASCYLLAFIFVAYAYPPARANFGVFRTLAERLSMLFLSFEPKGQPYAAVGAAWVAPWVYPVLTAFNWLMTIGCAPAWCWLGFRLWRDTVGGGAATSAPALALHRGIRLRIRRLDRRRSLRLPWPESPTPPLPALHVLRHPHGDPGRIVARRATRPAPAPRGAGAGERRHLRLHHDEHAQGDR